MGGSVEGQYVTVVVIDEDFSCVLWYIYSCRLFIAKSFLYMYILDILGEEAKL